MTPLWEIIVASVASAVVGGVMTALGAFAGVRVEIRYLADGVKEAKASATRAHQRIDSLSKPEP